MSARPTDPIEPHEPTGTTEPAGTTEPTGRAGTAGTPGPDESRDPADGDGELPAGGGRPARVFVDARWTRTDAHDGISRFGAELIRALHALHPVTMLINDRRQLALLPAEVPHIKINSPFSVRELSLASRLHALGADVVFSPMQVIGGFGRRYRLVLTLHDLIYYRHPEPPGFLPLPVRVIWRLYHRAYWPQRLLLNRADAVVTVSDPPPRLIRRHRLTRRPVTVVPNAPSGLPEPVDAEQAPAGQVRELVYMGSFMPYKDVETLIAGMGSLPGYRLHLLSRIAPAREAELRAQVPSGSDVVFWNGIDEDAYRTLLRGAAALVTASRDEGFGLPIIEAMHAGTPVVCSDLEIFREVTGGHARFFPVGDVAAFVAAVREVDDPEQRAELVRGGCEQAARFTWERSARRLLRVLVPGAAGTAGGGGGGGGGGARGAGGAAGPPPPPHAGSA
ncbi:glycosyltransferase family 1 protein [Saccharopolyspora sp. 6V]|uniref:glycosyltransferase family 4 protein n=1 Tax=Saccharopolyspora sp. 6V TaxID=2877239 RepID=UPI001CD69BAD|nr:glycosyltransferase family 1 protein [Saccharopolyspora sp. 6V]MCA1191180.1 glycosyltransferase family 4 protein [Saccharopolyspora sp. 6V]